MRARYAFSAGILGAVLLANHAFADAMTFAQRAAFVAGSGITGKLC